MKSKLIAYVFNTRIHALINYVNVQIQAMIFVVHFINFIQLKFFWIKGWNMLIKFKVINGETGVNIQIIFAKMSVPFMLWIYQRLDALTREIELTSGK